MHGDQARLSRGEQEDVVLRGPGPAGEGDLVLRDGEQRLRTRQTPILSFHQDKGIEHSIRISQLLHDVLPAEEEAAEEEPPAP